MRLNRLVLVLLSGASVLGLQTAMVSAADLVTNLPGTIVQDAELPAVSGFNGKWELDTGLIYSGMGLRAAGSLSAPLGDRFGIQGDVMGTWTAAHGPALSSAVHVFTRDPSRYLAGVTAGFVVTENAKLGLVGAEGELYLDRWSLEGWAGVAGLDFVDPKLVDKTGVFAMGDVAYYATDDLRIALGGRYLLGDFSLHTGFEYQFAGPGGSPLSLTGDARLHDNGAYTLTVGLKGYFGGSTQKSLIERHRQDDPPNRAIDIFNSAGNQIYQTSDETPPPPLTLEDQCILNGGYWQYPGEPNNPDPEACLPP
jgi:hypothetical protein